jgi:hypothetical protein
MRAYSKEKTPLICPKSNLECNCARGPQEIEVPVDMDGRISSLTIEKCGQEVVRKTLAQDIYEKLRRHMHDDM